MENPVEVLLQIARIPEAIAQEGALLSLIGRFTQGLGHLTVETDFKNEIGMSMRESGRGTGEIPDSGNGIAKPRKSGLGPETETDFGNERETGTEGETWTEKGRD